MNDGSGAWADVRKWIPQWGQFLGRRCRESCVLACSPGGSFCIVGIFSHILGSCYLHSRDTLLLSSIFFDGSRRPPVLVGRRAAVSSQGGFADLLRRRTSENTRQDGKRPLATFAFPVPPHPHPSLPFLLLFSWHNTSRGPCPSAE